MYNQQSSIALKDNSFVKLSDDRHINIFNKYSRSIHDLLKENEKLLLLSKQFCDKDGNSFYTEPLWRVHSDEVHTGNVMGFIGIDDVSIRITSRFTESKNDYFLHYMLQKTLLGQIIDLPVQTNYETKIWDFYYYLFPYYLNIALHQGVYKEYVDKQYNNMNIRGAVNVKRHIQKNIPSQFKVAYDVREHSYNNKITQLIRHTVEFIEQCSYGSCILNANSSIKESVEQIRQSTPNYNRSDRMFIVKQCVKPLNNPYWQGYENLRKLCLKILKQEGLSLNGSKDKVNGILFDGGWLWEEYLGSFIPKSDFKHPDNRKETECIYIFNNSRRRRYPDFYSRDRQIVLDAKYKHCTDSDSRDDLHQIITYMYILKALKGVLIYPGKSSKMFQQEINGYGGEFIQLVHNIPSDKDHDYKQFCHSMQKSEIATMNFISSIKI